MKNHSMKYTNLLLMAILSFISMYVFMYMMVDKYGDVYPNLNQFYMASMMTAPMVIIELALMGAMYPNKLANILIMLFSLLILFLFIFFIRSQTAISDKEFLKSMIPHHGGAILMCEQAAIKDPEIKKLCRTIISSQQSEIDWMKMKLNLLGK